MAVVIVSAMKVDNEDGLDNIAHAKNTNKTRVTPDNSRARLRSPICVREGCPLVKKSRMRVNVFNDFFCGVWFIVTFTPNSFCFVYCHCLFLSIAGLMG